MWFGAVGGLLGFVWYALASALAGVHLDEKAPLLAAAMGPIAIAYLTRMLHWDGLADVADAWWGGYDPERRRAIMSDSAVGSFGTTAVCFVAVLQVGASQAIFSAGALAAFVIAPVIGRLSATAAAVLGTAAKDSGLGRSVMAAPGAALLAVVGVTEIAVYLLSYHVWGWTGVGATAGCELVALAVPHVLSSRVGGVTGDVMGASVLLVETAVLIVFGVVGVLS